MRAVVIPGGEMAAVGKIGLGAGAGEVIEKNRAGALTEIGIAVRDPGCVAELATRDLGFFGTEQVIADSAPTPVHEHLDPALVGVVHGVILRRDEPELQATTDANVLAMHAVVNPDG